MSVWVEESGVSRGGVRAQGAESVGAESHDEDEQGDVGGHDDEHSCDGDPRPADCNTRALSYGEASIKRKPQAPNGTPTVQD